MHADRRVRRQNVVVYKGHTSSARIVAIQHANPVNGTVLGLGLIQIAIAIGIGIDFLLSRSVGFFRFPHLVSSSAQSTEHRRHTIEFSLPFPAFGFVQRLADDQNVLYGGALQG